MDEPQRSPLPTGAETSRRGPVCHRGRKRLNEVRSPRERRHDAILHPLATFGEPQRSPLPTGAETRVDARPVQVRSRPASTKSAPHGSGDCRGRGQRAPVVASTKSAPHGSGDGEPGGRRRDALLLASTKSAPHGSGDQRAEVRVAHRDLPAASTKSAPHGSGDGGVGEVFAGEFVPQRSPLPTGAETGGGGCRPRRRRRLNEVRSPRERRQSASTPWPARPRLNEVRSPRERRQAWATRLSASKPTPQRSPLPTGAETDDRADPAGAVGASTKSAPHGSGDHRGPRGGIPHDFHASTKSAPHGSGDV